MTSLLRIVMALLFVVVLPWAAHAADAVPGVGPRSSYYSYDGPAATTTPAPKLRAATHAAGPTVVDVTRSATPLISRGRATKGVTHAIPEGRVGHIFTPASRKLLQGVADDPRTTLGADKFGNTWSARTLDDGTQAWTQTRNGDLINGGLNPTPRPFNPQTGLSRLEPPR